MTWFDEHPGHAPRTLPPEQAAYYHRVLATHADDPDTGVCRICRQARCRDWRHAYDVLAEAGEPMDTGER